EKTPDGLFDYIVGYKFGGVVNSVFFAALLLREIERTDREIDNLVYDLYGLSDEERKIVKAEG
ncbi:unnamed protein product, partial [marine sediment metagenome]